MQPTAHRHEWAVIFDLDETLVLSSALEPLRRRRDWQAVYAGFGRTRLPDGTVAFLKRMSQIASVGVVTKAQRRYAERLLAHHGIQVPVLVAYHDVKKIKPDPEALLLASQRLGIPVERCLYVGDDANDVKAARAAGFTPVGVCWGRPLDIGLEVVCKNWEEVYGEIVRIIKR